MANKIIEGIESSIGRHAYTATLYSEPGISTSCTGFLIAPNVVLTEASSYCSRYIQQVAFGCTDTADLSSCDEVINVEEFIRDFNNVKLTNTGLGLLILAEDSAQSPVKLLDLHEDIFSDNFRATVVGFGNTEVLPAYSYVEASDKLQEAEITLVDGKHCLSQYTSTINIQSDPYALVAPKSDKYFCSEQLDDDVRICDNDDGAGAILKCASDNEQDVLLGVFIASFGCGNSGMPPIFSKLNSFEAMAFIRTQLEDRNIFIDFAKMSSCSNGFTTTNVAPTPYPTIPNHWFCEGYKFAGGEECDCNCGQFDPDCEFPENKIVGCLPGQSCNLDGNCVFDNTLEAGVPDDWICDPTLYDDGEFCDCNCGVVDPDCAKFEEARGCLNEQTCGSTGRCEGVGKAVPVEWTCIHSFYAALDGCDCNCGVFDPDCFVEGQEVFGCPEETPYCYYDRCEAEQRTMTKEQDEEVIGEEAGSVSVSFNGTSIAIVVAVGFFATVAFTVHTYFKSAKKDEIGKVVSTDANHTL